MEQFEETSSPTPTSVPKDKNVSNFWRELLQLLVISAVIVIPFRLYVAQPFIVDGLSMYPTFDNGKYLIIDELTYHFEAPERGSVLVFKYPYDTSKYFIKRVIGLPGETVRVKNGKVSIMSKDSTVETVLDEPYVELFCDDTKSKENGCVSNVTETMDEGEYFVMGDNRFQSADSRMWGVVPTADIVGRPIIQFLPPRLFPGATTYELGKLVQ